ncbi:TPA: hypothetical protein U2I61_002004 [Providencia rettgeri]|nr:hypothetical protein [Providencia rettgeri]
MKEEIKSVAKEFSSKVKNPILFTFGISWIFFNWKIILFTLFSDYSVLIKINYITENSSKITVLYAFLTSIFYALLMPALRFYLKKCLVNINNQEKDIIYNEEQAALNNSINLSELRAKEKTAFDRIVAGDEKEIQEMRESITISKNRVGQLTEELDNLKKELAEKTKEITEKTKEIALKNDRISILSNENGRLKRINKNTSVSNNDDNSNLFSTAKFTPINLFSKIIPDTQAEQPPFVSFMSKDMILNKIIEKYKLKESDKTEELLNKLSGSKRSLVMKTFYNDLNRKNVRNFVFKLNRERMGMLTDILDL